jgi:hypothetical protein
MRHFRMFTACACLGLVSCSTAPPPSFHELRQIEGEILLLDSDGYVITDGYGRKFRVQAAPSARVDGNLSLGDVVLVRVAAPYAPNLRYAKAVHLFRDIETTYGELIAKDSATIRIKDPVGRETQLSLDDQSVGYGRPRPGDRIFVKTYRAPYEGEVQDFQDGAYIIRDIDGREVRYQPGDDTDRPDSRDRRRHAVERPAMRHDRPYARVIYLFTDPLSLQGTLLRRDDGLYAVTGSEELALIIGQATVQDAKMQPGEQVFVVVSPLPVIEASAIEKL